MLVSSSVLLPYLNVSTVISCVVSVVFLISVITVNGGPRRRRAQPYSSSSRYYPSQSGRSSTSQRGETRSEIKEKSMVSMTQSVTSGVSQHSGTIRGGSAKKPSATVPATSRTSRTSRISRGGTKPPSDKSRSGTSKPSRQSTRQQSRVSSRASRQPSTTMSGSQGDTGTGSGTGSRHSSASSEAAT